MAEDKKALKKQSKPLAVVMIDMTKPAIRQKLEGLQKATKATSWHSGKVLKLAFISFAADIVGLEAGTEERQRFFAQLSATPGWFGSGNPSACSQDYDKKDGAEQIADDYSSL